LNRVRWSTASWNARTSDNQRRTQRGTRISEQALAASLGVSRSPLREALSRLEGRRLIERIPNVGARVVELHPENLEEVLAIREALETLACRLAATT